MSDAKNPLIFVFAAALLVAALASACGGANESMEIFESDTIAERAMPAAPAAMSVQESAQAMRGETVVVAKEVVREMEVELAQPAAPAAMAVKAQSGEVRRAISAPASSQQQPAQLVAQRRIIIRTVNMSIVVDDIQDAIDHIARIADESGGWMVSSDRSLKHAGSVSVRVPATGLDSVVETLRQLAVDVESEVSTSQDVTDEYFDLQSRLTNQRATEEALIRLLDRAENVQHALEVQRELTNVQENIERMLGRIKLLEETSAYSLITVHLSLAPVAMTVNAGPDQSVAVHAPVRFRATFTPPDGMDQHNIVWDFGDGSEPVYISRTAPTTEDGERVTATVTHYYEDPKDSPFIVQVSIDSYGESGVAEGEDTLIVTVSETPVIEVFAGDRSYRVLQNEIVEFSGSFTRPPGLTNVRYKWDFGDGSPADEGELAEGVTRVNAAHAYTDFRSWSYDAIFTVTADSAVGEIESSASVSVYVEQDPGLIVGGFNVADNAKTAVRTLSLVFSGLTTVAIWVGIFAIIWVPVAILVVVLIRRNRGNRPVPPTGNPNPPQPPQESQSQPGA